MGSPLSRSTSAEHAFFVFEEAIGRFETTVCWYPACKKRASTPPHSIPALACFFCCCLNFRRIRFNAYLFPREVHESEKNKVEAGGGEGILIARLG